MVWPNPDLRPLFKSSPPSYFNFINSSYIITGKLINPKYILNFVNSNHYQYTLSGSDECNQASGGSDEGIFDFGGSNKGTIK